VLKPHSEKEDPTMKTIDKKAQKLSVKKQTIRTLSGAKLHGVAGGAVCITSTQTRSKDGD
jgi:hypothetical protein